MDILRSPKDEGGQPKGSGHNKPISPEADAIDRLGEIVKNGIDWIKSHADFVTNNELREMEKRIMATYKEAFGQLVAAQGAFNTRVETSVDGVVASVAGVTTDLEKLQADLEAIQNSVGPISAEDQVSLDAAIAKGESLSGRMESVDTALKALDALRPPTVTTPVG